MTLFEGLDSRVVLLVFVVAMIAVIAGVLVSNWMASRRKKGSDEDREKPG